MSDETPKVVVEAPADVEVKIVAAHDQVETLHIVAHVPAHPPREDDPHYHLFEEARARMKKLGLLKCVVDDDYCGGGIELHHMHVEFSQQADADREKVNKALGLHIEDDEAFAQWIESPGNLEALCVNHHRTHFGVHTLPHALWEAVRWRKSGTRSGAEVITSAEWDKGRRS